MKNCRCCNIVTLLLLVFALMMTSGMSCVAAYTRGTPTSTGSYKITVMKYDGADWTVVGSPEFSAGPAYYTSICVAAGTPYVAYYDGKLGKVAVMSFNGASWEAVGDPNGISQGSVLEYGVSIDVFGGFPYVAYYDGGLLKGIVQKYNGVSWEAVGPWTGFSTGKISFPSLKIAWNGDPYVAYADNSDSDKAVVMKYSGGSWNTVGGGAASIGQTGWTSLALSTNTLINPPHVFVAYEDIANGKRATVEACLSGSSNWLARGTNQVSTSAAYGVSMCLRENPMVPITPEVVFEDVHSGSKATVMYLKNNNLWQPIGNPGFSSGEAFNTCIAKDGGVTTEVAFIDVFKGSKISVMKFDGTNWVYVGNPGFTPHAANHISFYIYNGIPYVAFRDG